MCIPNVNTENRRSPYRRYSKAAYGWKFYSCYDWLKLCVVLRLYWSERLARIERHNGASENPFRSEPHTNVLALTHTNPHFPIADLHHPPSSPQVAYPATLGPLAIPSDGRQSLP